MHGHQHKSPATHVVSLRMTDHEDFAGFTLRSEGLDPIGYVFGVGLHVVCRCPGDCHPTNVIPENTEVIAYSSAMNPIPEARIKMKEIRHLPLIRQDLIVR